MANVFGEECIDVLCYCFGNENSVRRNVFLTNRRVGKYYIDRYRCADGSAVKVHKSKTNIKIILII